MNNVTLSAYSRGQWALADLRSRASRELSASHSIAWYVIAAIVLLALGATVYLGALAYCMLTGRHLYTLLNIGGGQFKIGCV